MRRLPQRYPFLFVDRVLSWDVQTRCLVAVKQVSRNEAFFQGHFPGNPMMPGTLIVEAIGQSASLLASLLIDAGNATYYLASADGIRFRRSVYPGDTMTMHVRCDSIRGRFLRVHGRCEVDGESVVTGVVTLALGNLPPRP